jgi:pimeloyl-ACP methyl ester carboxylesterase
MALELMPLVNRAARAVLVRRGARSRTVELNGHTVHLLDLPGRTSGPALVLMHGLGSSSLTFSRILPALTRHASRVLAADLPGAGFSPEPARPLSLEDTVRFLADLYTRELQGQPAVFVGNSLGGAMALVLASERPDLMRGLVLVAPAGAKMPPERFQALVRTFDMRSWRDGRDFLRRIYHRPPRLIPELLGPEMVTNFSRAAVKEYLAGDRPTNYVEEERLARLSMPLLLLWGKSEKLLPYESIDYFRAHLPQHAQIEEVEGFGHVPHLDAARSLVERIGRFMAALPAHP